MSQMIVVHEVDARSIQRQKFTLDAALETWLETSNFLLHVALRQFGFSAESLVSQAKVWIPGSFGRSNPHRAFLIRSHKKFDLLCLIFNTSEASPREIDDYRRPGSKFSKELSSQLGLEFKTDFNVYSVAVSEVMEWVPTPGARDAWLVLGKSDKHDSAALSELFLLGLSLGIERAIINNATVTMSPKHSFLSRWRRHLSLLRSFPTLPPIDKTELAGNYLALRNSLNLDIRRSDVLKRLELQERNFGLFLASAATLIALVSLIFAAAKP